MKYDYLIVGCGLYGSVIAQRAIEQHKTVLIIDKRNHIGGNCYTEKIRDIDIHKYGPHIFHTNNDHIWEYVNRFTKFNNYVNRPKVNYRGHIYSFPINLMTLYQLWGVKNPKEAKQKLDEVKIKIENPNNLEEWILSQVGEEIYYTFIYGYTKKQWNTEPKNLPSFIIKRLPIRLNFDDNYFYDKYQGIPKDGYTSMILNMIDGADFDLNIDYFSNRDYWDNKANKVIFTGKIDEFYDYKFGYLNYRGLKFENIILNDINDFQGNAIINYTDSTVPYTRIIEHKHFTFNNSHNTIITKEYPDDYDNSKIPYYPINTEENNKIYKQYANIAKQEIKYSFGGRLAEYRYYDMHQIIAAALKINI